MTLHTIAVAAGGFALCLQILTFISAWDAWRFGGYNAR